MCVQTVLPYCLHIMIYTQIFSMDFFFFLCSKQNHSIGFLPCTNTVAVWSHGGPGTIPPHWGPFKLPTPAPSRIARGQHDLNLDVWLSPLDEITALSRLKENHIPPPFFFYCESVFRLKRKQSNYLIKCIWLLAKLCGVFVFLVWTSFKPGVMTAERSKDEDVFTIRKALFYFYLFEFIW